MWKRPFESLPAPVQQAVLHGSGEEDIAFSYILDSGASKGRPVVKQHLRGHPAQHGAALPRDRFGGGARRSGTAAAPSPAPNATARACAAKPAT